MNRYELKKGETYQVIKKCDTEDWKTAMARPKDFPTLKKGHKVVYKGELLNFYGCYAKVKPEGIEYTYYIEFDNLEPIKE